MVEVVPLWDKVVEAQVQRMLGEQDQAIARWIAAMKDEEISEAQQTSSCSLLVTS